MKPKIAFFDFASCEGCQLAVLNCEDILLDLLNLVDIVEFREAISEKAPRYDVAFVEGSINREKDAVRLREIRARSRVLVALGACACGGNVQARSNALPPVENYDRVYGKDARNRVQVDNEFWPYWTHARVQPIGDVVDVDYYLRGCPIAPGEFAHLVKSLIVGAIPSFPANAVCVECKENGNECVFDHGDTCMGQITWGGCGAVCVNNGYRCDGCRGLLPHANVDAHRALLAERELSPSDIHNRYGLFLSAQTRGKEARV
ncbi:MAG: NADH:ubiquinone oxidoreductase [Deltaproteobacteria bacterium]|nr:NADH:ubiquinone oxidoreductase [Deltaproteobacteria bacterium]